MQAEDGQVACPNCGASYSIDEASCPYCGGFNPAGAEKAYMEELDDIKHDTGELAEDARRGFMANLQQNTRRIVIVAIVVVAAIAAIFLIANGLDKRDEQQEIKSYQARESFREKYFPEFDRLYEAGDDEALSEYVWSLVDAPGFDALQSWEHYGYLEVHDDWEVVKVADAHFKNAQEGIDDYVWVVSKAIHLVGLDAGDWRSSAQLTEQEEARAADYRAFGWTFLQETLQMNKEEVTAFAESVLDERGNVDRDKLQRKLEPRLKELGTIR